MKIFALFAALSLCSLGAASCQKTSTRSPDIPKTKMKDQAVDAKGVPEGHETITLGAGCFWCVEAVYQQLEGVRSAASGYMGGLVPNPTYEQVCSKNTGHVEVVRVVYDPKKTPTSEILSWFWELHDPTSKDRQGRDAGPQYRSVIFYHTEAQKKAAEASLAAARTRFDKPIVTEIRKAAPFYKADESHQDFYFRNKGNNYCRAVIQPKLNKLKLKD